MSTVFCSTYSYSMDRETKTVIVKTKRKEKTYVLTNDITGDELSDSIERDFPRMKFKDTLNIYLFISSLA